MIKMFTTLTVVTVALLYAYVQTHQILQIKRADFLRQLHLNEAVKKIPSTY